MAERVLEGRSTIGDEVNQIEGRLSRKSMSFSELGPSKPALNRSMSINAGGGPNRALGDPEALTRRFSELPTLSLPLVELDRSVSLNGTEAPPQVFEELLRRSKEPSAMILELASREDSAERRLECESQANPPEKSRPVCSI